MLCAKLRNLILFAWLAMLASCGFTPALEQASTSSVVTEGIDVSVAGDREGFFLEEFLERRLGTTGSSSVYNLAVRLDVTERDEATSGSGGIDRKSLEAVANYEIRAKESDEIVAAGIVEGAASYSVAKGIVASGAARRDAEKRMLTEVADRLYTRLILTADEWVP